MRPTPGYAGFTRSATAMLLSSALVFAPSLVDAASSFDSSMPSEMAMKTPYDLSWTTDASSVKVTLVNPGADPVYHLIDIFTNIWILNDMSRATSSDKTSYRWTLPTGITTGTYVLMINADDDSTATSTTFQVVDQGDAPAVTTAPPTSTSSSASSTTGGTSSTSSSTSNPAASDTSPTSSGAAGSTSTGLSTGAKAGIGVGAAIGGLAMMGALGFFLFRLGKRSGKKHDDEEDDGGKKEEGSPLPKEAELVGDSAQPMETKDTGVAEMQAPDVIHEAPDYKQRLDTPNQFVSELDATGGTFTISRPGSSAPVPLNEKNADEAGNKPAFFPVSPVADSASPVDARNVSRPTTSGTHVEGLVSPEGTLQPSTAAALMAITQGEHTISPVTPTASIKANSILGKDDEENHKRTASGSGSDTDAGSQKGDAERSARYETPDDIGRSPSDKSPSGKND